MRMRLITRRALFRLGLLALTLALILLGGYLSMIRMPGQSWTGPLPPLGEEEAALRDRLRVHVVKLAGQIGERTAFLPERLSRAAAWIEGQLSDMGYAVAAQEYIAEGTSSRILAAELPGGERKEEVVLLGAHYDSVVGSPGANDNATGVAALLEIARALSGRTFPRTLRFVAFPNEEPPFFQTPLMGSLVYARACRERGEEIAAMLSLETLGYYRDEPGTQTFPAPLQLLYPDTADFIGFVGNWRSRALVRRSVALFREHARFPSQGGAVPGWITGVGWSDHWAFWEAGYRAIMVTDTALFRYPYYHTLEDTPDKLDYDRLARVTEGLKHVAAGLAEG
jgi:Zn-dependent M28 family amino/carboxypeptidase